MFIAIISTVCWLFPCKIFTEISPRSRQDLGEILGEFLAAEILRSRRDLKILAAKNLPRISLRYWRDPLRDLADISKYRSFLSETLKLVHTLN